MAMNRISPNEAFRLMQEEGYAYLDVRSIPEFQAGHPEGAYNIPLAHMTPSGMDLNPDFLDVVRATFDRNAKLIVGCKSGGRSLAAAQQLIADGYTQIREQKAGYAGSTTGPNAESGWQPCGLPISVHPQQGRTYEELAHRAGKG